MSNLNNSKMKKGDILHIPLGIEDFCSYCPCCRGDECKHSASDCTNDACEINILERTITFK